MVRLAQAVSDPAETLAFAVDAGVSQGGVADARLGR